MIHALSPEVGRLLAQVREDVEGRLSKVRVVYPFGLYLDHRGQVRPVAAPLGEDERPVRKVLRRRTSQLLRRLVDRQKASAAALVDVVVPPKNSNRGGALRVEVYRTDRQPAIIRGRLVVHHRPLLPDAVTIELTSVSE